jgi:cob(I)alamin adenosyltransferase
MKSPFPGMDPYIEECGLFEDFHDALISEIKHAVADVLPARYVVRTAERQVRQQQA